MAWQCLTFPSTSANHIDNVCHQLKIECGRFWNLSSSPDRVSLSPTKNGAAKWIRLYSCIKNLAENVFSKPLRFKLFWKTDIIGSKLKYWLHKSQMKRNPKTKIECLHPDFLLLHLRKIPLLIENENILGVSNVVSDFSNW